jgi:hypothetical protein
MIAAPTDGGVGSIAGACPIDGLTEIYLRDGTTWSPIGFANCQPNESSWSFSSSQLQHGVEAATLFTPTSSQNTGAFSPSLEVP